ncbi:MAG TPA: hypothetical protein VGE30_03140 [Candidatus Saccharimonadales bacterium]
MKILQVTPETVIEHEVFPGEELHPRLNTVEARRFIAALANGERGRFEALVDENGDPDPRQQESYIIQKWNTDRDIESLAGHNSTRALHSIRHFFDTHQSSLPVEAVYKRFHYPLLETPKAPFIADLHWDMENRIRRGVGIVISAAAHLEGNQRALVELAPLKRTEVNNQAPNGRMERLVRAGHIAMHNTVLFSNAGLAIGSDYLFSVHPNSVEGVQISETPTERQE